MNNLYNDTTNALLNAEQGLISKRLLRAITLTILNRVHSGTANEDTKEDLINEC
jgi:hypothetical protein